MNQHAQNKFVRATLVDGTRRITRCCGELSLYTSEVTEPFIWPAAERTGNEGVTSDHA